MIYNDNLVLNVINLKEQFFPEIEKNWNKNYFDFQGISLTF